MINFRPSSSVLFGNRPDLNARKAALEGLQKKNELAEKLNARAVQDFLKGAVLPAVAGQPALTGWDLFELAIGFDQYGVDNSFASTERMAVYQALGAMETQLKLIEPVKGSSAAYPEPEYQNYFTVGYRYTDFGQYALANFKR